MINCLQEKYEGFGIISETKEPSYSGGEPMYNKTTYAYDGKKGPITSNSCVLSPNNNYKHIWITNLVK